MALKNKTKNNGEFKYIVSKNYLSDDEMAGLISCVVDEVVENNDDLPYYANKHSVTKKYTIACYIGEVESENRYDIIRDILSQIDLDQYDDILEAIDDGIKYELSKKVNVFGELNSTSTESSIQELSALVDKIGVDKIDKLIAMGAQTDAVKTAQSEVKAIKKQK